MISENDLRQQLATCTRIFAMQGMIGVFGHVSVYQPETKRVFITPGMGSDKGSLRPENMVSTDLQGNPLEGRYERPKQTDFSSPCQSKWSHKRDRQTWWVQRVRQ